MQAYNHTCPWKQPNGERASPLSGDDTALASGLPQANLSPAFSHHPALSSHLPFLLPVSEVCCPRGQTGSSFLQTRLLLPSHIWMRIWFFLSWTCRTSSIKKLLSSQPPPPLFSSCDLGSVLLRKLSLWHKDDHELKPGKNVKSLWWETQKQGMAAFMHGKASRAFKSPT